MFSQGYQDIFTIVGAVAGIICGIIIGRFRIYYVLGKSNNLER